MYVLFLLSIAINASDVFVRTQDMNEFSKSIHISQKLKNESQLINSLLDDYHYDGNPIQLACHSKAFGDLELLAQSESTNLFLPVKKESQYDLYKLAHYMQISQDRMRAIQRELCYSMDEFRKLPDEIKGMIQNDIEKDPDIQYHLVQSGMPELLPVLYFDTTFSVFDKRYIGRIVDICHEESEIIKVDIAKTVMEAEDIVSWPLQITRQVPKTITQEVDHKHTKQVVDNRNLELYSLADIFEKCDHSILVKPENVTYALTLTIPLNDPLIQASSLLVKSFGNITFVNNKKAGTLKIFINLKDEIHIPSARDLQKIAYDKHSHKKRAWLLFYDASRLSIAKLDFNHSSMHYEQTKIYERTIGETALYDVIYDKEIKKYRMVYCSPRVDDGNSITIISWNDDFDKGVQQKILLNSFLDAKLQLTYLKLCSNNQTYFCGSNEHTINAGMIHKFKTSLPYLKMDCNEKQKKHGFLFDISMNGLVEFKYIYAKDHCCISQILLSTMNKCLNTFPQFYDQHTTANVKFLDDKYLACLFLRPLHIIQKRNHAIYNCHYHAIRSLKPIMALYKELLPRFKKAPIVEEPHNNNAVVIE